MLQLKSILFAGCILAGGVGTAFADITGPNGEKCESTESQVKHDIGGKHYVCDKCVILSCSTSTNQLKDCKQTTHWVNCTPDQQ